MGERALAISGFFLVMCVASARAELPAPPPVPASLAAPELTAAQRAAVEQAFRELRERALASAEAQAPAAPLPPEVPVSLPSPTAFDAETQARIDASFAPLAMRGANMGSLQPTTFAASRAPASLAQEEQAAPASSPLPGTLNFLDFWPEDKKRLVAQELYLGLEKDEVPADSLVGRLLQAQRDRAAEEGSLFRQVRSAYRAREHLFQPLRVAGAGH